MSDLHSIIDSTVNNMRDEIILFIQTLVQSPSLANDEESVQKIIQIKLESLGLETKKVIVQFESIKNHPAFCDDGYSPDSRYNILGNWQNEGSGKSLILNGHVDVVPT